MKKSILVIDPDENMRKIFDKEFSAAGHEIFSAECIEQGLRLLKEVSTFDGVLIDVGVFHENMAKIISEIKASKEELVLLLMGRLATPELIECIKNGTNGFIEKPFQEFSDVISYVEKQFNDHSQDTSPSPRPS